MKRWFFAVRVCWSGIVVLVGVCLLSLMRQLLRPVWLRRVVGEVGLFRLMWWRVLDDSRFLARFVCARSRRLALFGICARWVLHVLAGNFVYVASLVLLVWLPFPWLVLLVAGLVGVAGFEGWFHWWWFAGRGSWLHGWRLWCRVRRSVPAEWADAAAKTREIQSSIGKEHRGAVGIRPVADHPKLGWFPRVDWPVLTVRCGHPPGRSFDAAKKFRVAMAANILRVEDIDFDFDRNRSSIGWMTVTFVDVLSDTVAPARSLVDMRERRSP